MSKKNHLMEAAADILSRSHAAAPKEEMHKVEGEVQDLGGSTPQGNIDKKFSPQTGPGATAPGKPAPVGQQSQENVPPAPEVIDPLDPKGGDGDSSENAEILAAQKKAAGLKEEKEEDKDEDEGDEDEKDEDEGDEDEKDKKDDEDFKKKLKEDVDAILASESDLSEEFRTKIATIYTARVIDKVNQISEEMAAQFQSSLTEAVEAIGAELTEKTNDYLNYVVEEWMDANELAVEKGLRAELVEEFIGGLHALFAEHYIDVPADKVNVIEELAGKVETLEASLNEEIARGVALKKQLNESKKAEVLASVCEGLTAPAADKIRTLAESVEFTAEGDFRKKVEVLRENYFPTKVKQAEAAQLNEVVEMQPEVPSHMKAYADAIARSVVK